MPKYINCGINSLGHAVQCRCWDAPCCLYGTLLLNHCVIWPCDERENSVIRRKGSNSLWPLYRISSKCTLWELLDCWGDFKDSVKSTLCFTIIGSYVPLSPFSGAQCSWVQCSMGAAWPRRPAARGPQKRIPQSSSFLLNEALRSANMYTAFH